MQHLTKRLEDNGVVDVKFVKSTNFYMQSPEDQARDMCVVLEQVLEGNYSPAPPFGDSVMDPNMLSPVTRCGGGHNGDQHENNEKGGTSAS